jgi:hypothetical protein
MKQTLPDKKGPGFPTQKMPLAFFVNDPANSQLYSFSK